VEELADFLAFKCEARRDLTFEESWRPENLRDTVLFYTGMFQPDCCRGCGRLASDDFSHFSVKEYLASSCISKGRVSHYSTPLESAHLFVTQASAPAGQARDRKELRRVFTCSVCWSVLSLLVKRHVKDQNRSKVTSTYFPVPTQAGTTYFFCALLQQQLYNLLVAFLQRDVERYLACHRSLRLRQAPVAPARSSDLHFVRQRVVKSSRQHLEHLGLHHAQA
jgi:hypothetical protein